MQGANEAYKQKKIAEPDGLTCKYLQDRSRNAEEEQNDCEQEDDHILVVLQNLRWLFTSIARDLRARQERCRFHSHFQSFSNVHTLFTAQKLTQNIISCSRNCAFQLSALNCSSFGICECASRCTATKTKLISGDEGDARSNDPREIRGTNKRKKLRKYFFADTQQNCTTRDL